MKFYSFEDAKIIAESLKNAYGNPVRVCFDKREIKDSKWYCVVFRMEGGGDQKLGKFVQLMDDIFKEIPGDEKNAGFEDNLAFKSMSLVSSVLVFKLVTSKLLFIDKIK